MANGRLKEEHRINLQCEMDFTGEEEKEPLLLIADHIAAAFRREHAPIIDKYKSAFSEKLFVGDSRFEYEFPNLDGS
ncbi:MAG TPA: hypothetical protein QF533_06725 [Nitrospinota bacterium]|jgi:hypothetical protein|nr:hypothetical protein [Nitrospinota bacterium]|tara:strand:- start:288 stop:518 length:231 start_codon:yes stop_codon:yes gene_type:complete